MALEEGKAFGRPKAHVTDAFWEAYTGRSTFHYNSIKKLTSYVMTRQKSQPIIKTMGIVALLGLEPASVS
jgi:hypothetical protein